MIHGRMWGTELTRLPLAQRCAVIQRWKSTVAQRYQTYHVRCAKITCDYAALMTDCWLHVTPYKHQVSCNPETQHQILSIMLLLQIVLLIGLIQCQAGTCNMVINRHTPLHFTSRIYENTLSQIISIILV